MAGLTNLEGERGLVQAAYQENVLYIVYSTRIFPLFNSSANSIPAIFNYESHNGRDCCSKAGQPHSSALSAGKHPILNLSILNLVLPEKKVSLPANINTTQEIFKRIEISGSKAIVLTVDSASSRTAHRALRYSSGSRNKKYLYMTWGYLKDLQKLTSLPIIPKGIQTVEDAQIAVAAGFPAIFLSNHGGRQLDGAPSALEVALEIHNEAPEIFQQVEVYADGGIRYGADVLKLLALGVRAVGLGRPFMYANIYGTEGVSRAIQLLKYEVSVGAGNLGVADVQQIDSSYVSLTISIQES